MFPNAWLFPNSVYRDETSVYHAKSVEDLETEGKEDWYGRAVRELHERSRANDPDARDALQRVRAFHMDEEEEDYEEI